MTSIARTDEWRELERLAERPSGFDLRAAFAGDPKRAERFTFEAGDLMVDLSKHLIDEQVLSALVELAGRAGLEGRVDALFRGDHINTTEDRAVLHPALRAKRSDRFTVDGEQVVDDVHEVLARMSEFANRVRDSEWRGHTGERIRDVVNIGIGGSDLGPAMAYRALRSYASKEPRVHYVSNVDPADLQSVLAVVEPESTLFIVASKTFTTLETLTNARAARSWLVDALGDDSAVASHFVAVSTNSTEVANFGIDVAQMFEFWDWVGGRYSMDSAIGLSLMIGVGPENFDEMLAGFREIDEHLRSTPLESNVPVLMGLVGIWYRNFLGFSTHAVLPYAQDLELFPAYLQQLDMESNGKRVRLDGSEVEYETGPIVWGEPGTNGQHAFYQLLHQGTSVVPADLIGFYEPTAESDGQHDILIGNMIAQAEALAFGKSAAEVREDGVESSLVEHRAFPGNRPTTSIMGPRLSPFVLGQLVALYEHKVLTQGIIWGINSFDQWGVELGKALASTVVEELRADNVDDLGHDSSTNAQILRYRNARGRA